MDPERVQRKSHGPSSQRTKSPGTQEKQEIAAWRAVVRVLRSTASNTVHSLTSVIFPDDCRVCGSPLSGFSLLPVCDSCWSNLPVQMGALCACCGESLPGDAGAPANETLCRMCRAAAPPFEKAVAHGVYATKLRALVHLLKYDGMEPLAIRLGALAGAQALTIADLPRALVVVPVPLFAGKRRQRGFNQSELLARGAMSAMRRNRPEMRLLLRVSALERQRATESQAGLSSHKRRVNVRNAFFVSRPAEVDGRDVLLIDDIYTTGATARACTRALKSAGAARVWVATVARAQREDMDHAPAEPPMDATGVTIGAGPREEIPMEEDVAFWEEGR
jgi:ComF family protein